MVDLAYIGPGGVGIKTPPGEPLQDAVQLFERLLEEAKSGQLRAAAVATLVERGVATTDFEFAYKGGAYGDLYLAVSQMHKRMLDDAG